MMNMMAKSMHILRFRCGFLFFLITLGSSSKLSKKTSHVEQMIASLRETARANHDLEQEAATALAGKSGHGSGDNSDQDNEEHPRPFTEKHAGEPCRMRGLVVRREMGDLGVTSFQVAVQEMVRDALGPSWQSYDDWPRMAQFLTTKKEPRWVGSVSDDEANAMRKECKRKVTISPFGQEAVGLAPFNITGGEWVKVIREQVCGSVPDNFEDSPCAVVKIQGHWQHAAFFYRYRAFLARSVFRSPESLRQEYVLGLTGTSDEVPKAFSGEVAELVVYLRLGDKAIAGDTVLTFSSGYFDAVLDEVRTQHKTCWIVTQTPKEPRAKSLASRHRCSLVSSPKQYTDWTLMLTAPKTLVMAASTFVYFQALIGAATTVHYPAVGFFHDKHNVCMRQRNPASHFAQIRLPIGDPKMVYHDVYSRNWFLTYDELAAEVAALPCDTILDQHVCDLDKNKYPFGAEGRYCYRAQNASSLAAQRRAQEESHALGAAAVSRFRRRANSNGSSRDNNAIMLRTGKRRRLVSGDGGSEAKVEEGTVR